MYRYVAPVVYDVRDRNRNRDRGERAAGFADVGMEPGEANGETILR